MRIAALTVFAACSLAISACGSDRSGAIADLTGDTTSGEALYGANCASCHGGDRAGTNAGPDIRGETEGGETINVILNGEDTMPAFAGTLSDQEIADILAFLQS